MTKYRRDPKPGWGQDQAPNAVRDTPQGKEVIWFRPKSAPKPERYDYSVPDRAQPGWRVYFLVLCFLAVPLCCIARLVATLIETGKL